jgi:hypothetical protein
VGERVSPLARRVVALAAIAAVGLAWPAQAGVAGQVPVRAGNVNEILGFVNSAWFGWSHTSARDPNEWDLYAQPVGGAPFRINPAGTTAFGGGITGNTIVYIVASPGADFGLRLFDLSTHATTDLAQLNVTGSDEAVPWSSGSRIVFERIHGGKSSVFLFDRSTQQLLLLASATGEPSPTSVQPQTSVQPDQVNGDYVTWSRFTRTHADAFLYRISTGTTTRIAAPGGDSQYWPAVTSNGTVYVGREKPGVSCGGGVSIVRITPDHRQRVLATMSNAFDVGRMIAVANSNATDLYFDRANCRTGAEHIYRLTDHP